MDNILLDTHIFLWYVSRQTRNIPGAILGLIADPTQANVFVSGISFIECITKHKLGRDDFRLPEPVSHNLTRWRQECLFDFLPLTETVMPHYEALPLPEEMTPVHKDPFDRMLIAQCVAENMVFATVDEKIKQYAGKVKGFRILF